MSNLGLGQESMSNLGLVQRSARFSPCGTYRYTLGRVWDARLPVAAGVLLNPSKADTTRDDPTTSQWINRLSRLGYGSWRAANLFAAVGTDPKCLLAMADPVGLENDTAIMDVLDGAAIQIIAWGTGGALHFRDAEVLDMLNGRELWCLGHNADGSPRFPRAVPINQSLVRFRSGNLL